MSVKLPLDYCPVCKHKLSGALSTDMDDSIKPSEGDPTICCYCTAYLKFGADLKLCILTQEEYADLPDEIKTELQKARNYFQNGQH